MADIKQAFIWLMEGKSVRRIARPPLPVGYTHAAAIKADNSGCIRCTCHGNHAVFFVDDPMAEDWEIVQP
jgi:hypothetical protein